MPGPEYTPETLRHAWEPDNLMARAAIDAHADAWEAEQAQNAINVDTLKAFQGAARERERALQAEIAILKSNRGRSAP